MIFEKQILDVYKGMMHTRCDDDGTAFYFSAKDFDGLIAEPLSFRSVSGNKLQGYLYYYGKAIPERIIIFDHGFGGGHRAYMTEIEKLCEHGYQVFSYDHTGCMESEGESPNGMAQSLCDLNDCISFIKKTDRFRGYDISVMGHSWGGFSTLNISALHPEISHVVVLSGFVSVELLVNDFFGGLLKGYRSSILDFEKKANPFFVGFNAVETLAHSKAKAFLIYSDNDKMVCRSHFDILKSALSHKANIKFKLEHNKGHNPNYTEDAVKYLNQYLADKKKLLKKKKLVSEEEKREFLASYDWKRMTKQDDNVWKEIFDFLDN